MNSETTHERQVRVFRKSGALLLLLPFGLLAAQHCQAGVVDKILDFTAFNQNPWYEGPAFVLDKHEDWIPLTWNQDISGSFTPTDIIINQLSDLVGKDLNSQATSLIGQLASGAGIFGAEFGGNTSGALGISYGLHVSGGTVDANYPVNVKLDLPSGSLTPGQAYTIGSSFSVPTPGTQGTVSLDSLLSTVKNNTPAYAASISNYLTTTASKASLATALYDGHPYLETTFPSFNASANLIANVSGSLYVNVTALGQELARINTDLGSADYSQSLASISSHGVSVLGTQFVNFDSSYQIGGVGSVSFQMPTLDTHGGIAPDGSLTSGGVFPNVISLQINASSLVPLPLSGGVGPVGYTLLSASAGPELGIAQHFDLQPTTRVKMVFNSPVQYLGSDGKYHLAPNNTVDFAAGEAVNIRPVGTSGFLSLNALKAQPTYYLQNSFENKTNLSLGLAEQVTALSLNTPLGPATAYAPDPFRQSLGEVSLYDSRFPLSFDAIQGEEMTWSFDQRLGPTFMNKVAAGVTDGQGNTGLDLYQVIIGGNDIFDLYGREVTLTDACSGRFANLCAQYGIHDQVVFVSETDPVLHDGTTVPGVFCLVCDDMSVLFDNPSHPVVDSLGNLRYVSLAFDANNPAPCPQCDPVVWDNAGAFNDTHIISEPSTVVTLAPVPEPQAWVMLLAGLGLVGFAAKHRGANRAGPSGAMEASFG